MLLASDKVVTGYVCILQAKRNGIKHPNMLIKFVQLCEFTLITRENKIVIKEVESEKLKRQPNAALYRVRLELNLSEMCAPMEIVEQEDAAELEYSNSSLQVLHGFSEAKKPRADVRICNLETKKEETVFTHEMKLFF